MRLTLRTLLAYLDDVLEPADAQDIGKKIEESEFAANIVHRIRDVMRRLRLGAPRLSGRGMGLDANTVAEYLDNTLPGDRIADFEKVCLESDVHLAEVASCHQILAIVLGEAADVNPATRDRMYKLPQRVQPKEPEKEAVEHAAKEPAVAAAAAPMGKPQAEPALAKASKARRKVEVPDYLRQPEEERSWRKPATVAALAALLVLVLIMAIDGSWLARQLGLEDRPDQRVATTTTQPDAPADSPTPPDPDAVIAPSPEAPPAEPGPEAPAQTPAKPDSELEQPASVARPAPEAPPDAVAEPPLPRSPRETPQAPPETPPAAPASPTGQATAVPQMPATPPPAATATTETPMPAAVTPQSPPTTPPPPPMPAEPAPAQPAAPEGQVGRLVSTSEVLIRLDNQGVWQRVPAQDMLVAGEKLIALPAFRPNITLSNGITLELLGGSMAHLEAPAADGVPGVRLDYGRLVALTPRPEGRLKLTASGRQLLVTFGDAGSTIALEVEPVRPEGADPEAGPPRLRAALYVDSGQISLTEIAAGQTQEIMAPSAVSLGSEPITATELPRWVRTDESTPSEKIGAEFLAENLTLDRPALLGLKELAEHRRVEVRTLAAQSLARAGEFDPLVAALNQADPNFKTIWNNLIEDLRAAIARGPETAAKVREAFQRQRGESAAALYRMLWGYSLADYRADDGKALKQLVEYLDHSDMDFRALAFWNLRELTGYTLLYQPHANAEARRTYVMKWRQRLESGQLLPKVE